VFYFFDKGTKYFIKGDHRFKLILGIDRIFDYGFDGLLGLAGFHL